MILFLIFAATVLICRVLLSVVAPEGRDDVAFEVEIVRLGCVSVAVFRDVCILDVDGLDEHQVGILGRLCLQLWGHLLSALLPLLLVLVLHGHPVHVEVENLVCAERKRVVRGQKISGKNLTY